MVRGHSIFFVFYCLGYVFCLGFCGLIFCVFFLWLFPIRIL